MPLNKSTIYHPPPPALVSNSWTQQRYLNLISAMRRPFEAMYVGVREPPTPFFPGWPPDLAHPPPPLPP